MKLWAWLWVGSLALIGWIPALMISYGVAFLLAAGGIASPGPLVFGTTYAVLLGTGLLLQIQVRRYFDLVGAQADWFLWGGGGALVVTWAGAYLGFALQAGWI